jgi:tetratricopeptide (TPR) repeat protein
MIKRMAFCSLLAIGLFGCGGNDQDKDQSEKAAMLTLSELRDVRLAEIDSLEQVVAADTFFSEKRVALDLLENYEKYASVFPGDNSKTPEILYKAGALARGVGEPLRAIRAYDVILSKYRNFERNPEVAFLVAFTYDSDMNNPELARESYEEVIKRYPDDSWAIQARQRLETVDMTDEELIEFLMEKKGGNL